MSPDAPEISPRPGTRARSRGRTEPGRPTRLRLWILLPLLIPLLAAVVTPPRRARWNPEESPAAPRQEKPPPEPTAPGFEATAAVPYEPNDSRQRERVPGVDLVSTPTTSAPAQAAPEPAGVELLVLASHTGRPIQGATVELGHTATGSNRERVRMLRTDARGRVNVACPAGLLRATAWDDRLAGGPVHLELAQGDERTHTLELDLAHEVAGRVIDAESQLPVAGATVVFWTFAERDVVRTLADGTFRHPRFPASEFAEQVRVEAEGYGPTVLYLRVDGDGWEQPAALEGGRSHSGTGTPWIEAQLVPELRVVARIVDHEGRPLAGASVSAEGYYRVLPDVASRDAALGHSDADGNVSITGLRSDVSHSILVTAEGHAALEIELAAGRRLAELGTLRLPRERFLSGTVVDADGYPVEDVRVELSPTATSLPDPFVETGLDVTARLQGRALSERTGRDGTFVFENLLERPYDLVVTRGAGALLEVELAIDEHRLAEHLELNLSPDTPTLRGRVLGPDGSAQGNCVVEVQRDGGLHRVRADEEGRFRVAGVADDGPYRLRVSVSSQEGTTLRAEAEAWAFESPVLRLELLDSRLAASPLADTETR